MRLMLLTLHCFFAADLIADDASNDSSQVLAWHQSEAKFQRDAANQQVLLLTDQQAVLQQLYQEGAASDLEVANIQIAIRKAHINRQSAAQRLSFLNDLQTQLQMARPQNSTDLLLIVPQLNHQTQSPHRSTIRVVNHPRLRRIMDAYVSSEESSTAEHRKNSPPLIVPFVQFANFQYKGHTIPDNADLMTVIDSQLSRTQADRKVRLLTAERNHLQKLHDRLQTVSQTAQLPWEQPLLNKARRANQLQLASAKQDIQSDHWIPAVFAKRAADHTAADDHRPSPRSENEDLLQRLEHQLAIITEAGTRVEALTATDSFFAPESQQLNLQQKLLAAEIKACHERAGHVAKVATAVSDIDEDHRQLVEATARIFASLGCQQSQQSVLETRLQISMQKLDGLQQLLRDGFASPAEVRHAENEVQQRKSAIAFLQQQQRQYASIADVLTEIAHRRDS